MPAKEKINSVRVRCYRQGLGDCFLLSFPTGKDKPLCHVLIDCGVWPKGEVSTAKMTEIANDIKSETGGEIDVLVATHEHWDHLSGFDQARTVFDSFKTKIRNTWFAWTEDETDELANELRKDKKKKEELVHKLYAHLTKLREQRLKGPASGTGAAPASAFSLSGERAYKQLGSMVGFLGAAAGKRGSTGEALNYLKALPDAKPSYHRPGTIAELPGVKNVRVFVLGPPHDRKKIRKSTPSKKHSEVYELFFGLGLEDSLLAAMGALDPAQAMFRDPEEVGKPFDASHRQYPSGLPKSYAAESWRRIDDDWMFAGGSLALHLDSATNNTSLALAFELPDGRVLLFPGDAQVGNWLSWHDHTWKWKDGETETSVSARDLLGRTVLYKVGHHGSHNATLRDLGLELMNDPSLTAIVPVSHQMALDNDWNRIPLPSLVKRLKEKAKGRVWFTVEFPQKFTNPEANQFTPAKKLSVDDSNALWIDVHL